MDGGTAAWTALYLVAAIATVLAVATGRRSTLRATPTAGVDARGLGPYQLAYLHDGTRLAVLAALSALHVSGRVEVREHLVRARPGGPGGVDGTPRHPLESAIVEAAGSPSTGTELIAAGPVEAALDALRGDLGGRGLLLGPERRTAIRRRAGWPSLLLGLGVVGLFPAGLTGASVGYPVLVLVGLAVAAWWWRRQPVPFRTVAGGEALARSRAAHEGSLRGRSDWTAGDPVATATQVGLFGIGELWVADPGFGDQVLPTGAPGSTRVADAGFWNGPTHGGDIDYPPDRIGIVSGGYG